MQASDTLRLAKDLWKIVTSSDKTESIDADRCQEILTELVRLQKAVPRHKLDTFFKTIATAQKCFRLAKRNNKGNDKNVEKYENLLNQCKQLYDVLGMSQKDDASNGKDDSTTSGVRNDTAGSLPSSVSIYLSRLERQKKEVYKNPPVLPPPAISIYGSICPLPKRDKRTGHLTFIAGENDDKALKEQVKDFCPNLTPEEILRGGAFGGTYFRTIDSAVTNERILADKAIQDTLPQDWIKGLNKKTMLCSSKYNAAVNKYKASCGGSLGMWESSGWISNVDPYGWFQWYCRFYQGRRTSDDIRQIQRWKGVAGVKGRFRAQLCNKIIAAGASASDAGVSPVIRQTLFHWGLIVTEPILEQHKRRK